MFRPPDDVHLLTQQVRGLLNDTGSDAGIPGNAGAPHTAPAGLTSQHSASGPLAPIPNNLHDFGTAPGELPKPQATVNNGLPNNFRTPPIPNRVPGAPSAPLTSPRAPRAPMMSANVPTSSVSPLPTGSAAPPTGAPTAPASPVQPAAFGMQGRIPQQRILLGRPQVGPRQRLPSPQRHRHPRPHCRALVFPQ